ncbi:uncharacterized protein LOC131624597 isoform X3 [Vicia villosa]|uniref:uncharacterized protein LOC131624597 isoform X3 n=1 Tax=Vicia villosa TaxID=3911 RepID=UPI00273A9E8F|nr:uncharacterized protein LOC131624597 isoform X3 [Vicia villosa]
MGDADAQYALGCHLRGHAGAAIAYGSLLLKGVKIPESIIKFSLKRGPVGQKRGKSKENIGIDPVEMAKEKFQIAAKAGCDLGIKWLARLEEEENRLLTQQFKKFPSLELASPLEEIVKN